MPEIDRTMSEAVRAAYLDGQEEERMEPLLRVDGDGRPVGRIGRGDAVIFYDIRGEREVELTPSLVEPGFPHFEVEPLGLQLRDDDRVRPRRFPCGWPSRRSRSSADTLGEVVARAGLRQLRVAESEKAIHVGYFLAGKRQEPFAGEERVTPLSPREPLAEPEMRATEVAASRRGWPG